MAVERMDNVGIVVEDIDAAIEFFTELGLELEGRAPIEPKIAKAFPNDRAVNKALRGLLRNRTSPTRPTTRSTRTRRERRAG